MIIRRRPDIPSSEITPESVYVNRRKFIAAAAVARQRSIVKVTHPLRSIILISFDSLVPRAGTV